MLDVSSNSLTSISPIAACIKLQTLDVSGNQLTELDCVSSLVCLTELHADYNQLTDVAVLGGCTGLKELTISNNAIEDITAFVTLTALEDLDFSYNQVTELPQWTEGALRNINGAHNQIENIDVLAKHSQLSYVYMDYNNIESVDALENCYYLVMVNIYGNPVELNIPESVTRYRNIAECYADHKLRGAEMPTPLTTEFNCGVVAMVEAADLSNSTGTAVAPKIK